MGSRFRPRLVIVALVALATGVSAQQQARLYSSEAEIRTAMAEAQAQGNAARTRAEALEATAARATRAVERTASEAAGIAARIQQAEARIAGQEAQVRLIERRRALLRARLAERQLPVVRLTAALQRLSRRPPALSLLRPGSVEDAMHLRALLDTMLPEVRRRTAALRVEIERARVLEKAARIAATRLRASEADLRQRRAALVSLETRQRLASRAASSTADREAERALALAEQARDLDSLTHEIGKSAELRLALARLPGPVLRPARPEEAQVSEASEPAAADPALPSYILPVSGRLVAGFGDAPKGMARSRGVVLAPRGGAQAIAPAGGRVAFAGPYKGYGQIVIIEHDGGWTSLVTGLSQLDTRVGQVVVTGSPLGLAGAGRPLVTLELRRDGQAVNPLEYVRTL